MWGHMAGFGDVGWVWMLTGWIGMVVFWGTIIWLIVWGVNKASGSSKAGGSSNPIEIARVRYAKGEITREQFEQLKHDLV